MSRAWVWGLVAALFAALIAFVPTAQAVRQVHLAAAGDFGARAATRTVLDGIKAANPDAAFALGDLKYQDVATEAEWCTYVKQSLGASFPFELVAGNHDTLENPDGAIDKFAACLPNRVAGLTGSYGKEYYLDFPSSADPLVRVISASPTLRFPEGTWNYKAGDAHYQWLNAAIDSGRAAGAKWIIVAAHKPCWSIGQHTCPPNTDFYNLLLSKRVDLVMVGHEHGYSRSRQMVSGTAACGTVPASGFNANCLSDTSSPFSKGTGTVFAVVGTGGTPIRPVNLGDPEAGYFASNSGSNLNPAYGYLDLQVGEDAINARFVTTSGGPFSDSFVIGQPTAPGNQAPLASFTSSTSSLRADVNGAGSSDPDGSIASHAWNWGDGSAAGSGAQANHTYAAAGTYSVTLTVRDNAGASASKTQSVTVTGGSPSSIVASDTFTRTVASGLGTAEKGGAYKQVGSTGYSVDGSAGVMQVGAGKTLQAQLPLSVRDVDATASLGYSTNPTGYFIAALTPRVAADSSAYRAKVRVETSGVARVSLIRVSSGVDTTVASATTTLTGMNSTKRIMIRTQLTGASPTTLRAKIWFAGTAEPASWAVQATDGTASLQGPGAANLLAYLSGSATAAVPVRWDDLVIKAP